jgi:hypothetical protein
MGTIGKVRRDEAALVVPRLEQYGLSEKWPAAAMASIRLEPF